MKIVEYFVLDAWDTNEAKAMRDLTKHVNIFISNGWQPIGGMTISYCIPDTEAENHWVVTQTMVKYESTP